MPDLIDPQVETRAATQAESVWTVKLDQVLEAERRANPEPDEPDTSTRFSGELITARQHSMPLLADWTNVGDWARSSPELVHVEPHSHNIIFLETRATTSTATTITVVRGLLRKSARDERISRLSPQRRELYERIRARRKEISRDDFDIDAAIREFREDG